MKRIIYFTLIIAFSLMSCSDFLEENYLSGENSNTITTSEAGMESLVSASYIFLRVWYGKENQWDLTESGTDLYTMGLDNRSAGFCTYNSWVGEEQNRMAAMWYEAYKALNSCNLGIRDIDNAPYKDLSLRDQRKGELLFLRAHYLWIITENWGAAHFSTEPVESAVHEAYNTPVSTFYGQIFTDLEEALTLVGVDTEYGRVNEAVTKAFLARTHLMWASYLKNGLTVAGKEYVATDAGASQTHFAQALTYAQDAINNYGFSLESNWSDIWDITKIQNNEVIWATVYSNDAIYTTSNLIDPWKDTKDDYTQMLYDNERAIQRAGGNQGHIMWEIRYENLSWGMERDLANGRGFQRWMPTKFFIDLFDANADQRFKGSFKSVWYANLAEENIPKWKPFMFVDGVKVDVDKDLWAKPMFTTGDTCIYFSKDPVPSSMKAKFNPKDLYSFHPTKGYLIFDINDMYLADGTPNDDIINRQFYFPITKKYEDPLRLELAQAYSQRDAYVMRISEMYLIAAEAAMETGNAGEAYNYLVELDNNRAIDKDGAALLNAYGVASGSDVTIDVILDERARELATEGLRFWDLKRTGKLVERVKAYNFDAVNIKDYHQLRFIPQEQMDAVWNTEEFLQNPGY